LDIGVLGYIGIVWPKEHSPEVWSIPPVTPCIRILSHEFYKCAKLLPRNFESHVYSKQDHLCNTMRFSSVAWRMAYQSRHVHPETQSFVSKYQSAISTVSSRSKLVQEVKFLIRKTVGPVTLFLPGHQLPSLMVCNTFLSIYT